MNLGESWGEQGNLLFWTTAGLIGWSKDQCSRNNIMLWISSIEQNKSHTMQWNSYKCPPWAAFYTFMLSRLVNLLIIMPRVSSTLAFCFSISFSYSSVFFFFFCQENKQPTISTKIVGICIPSLRAWSRGGGEVAPVMVKEPCWP